MSVLCAERFDGDQVGPLLPDLSFGLVLSQFRKLHTIDVPGQAELLERPDSVPVQIELIPLETMTSGNRVRVMIVVPAFAKGEQCNEPVIGGHVTSTEAARPPGVSGGIYQPGAV